MLVTSPELQGYLKFDSRMLTLREILKALQDPDLQTVWVYGMSGVGKTTLVKQVAAYAAKLELFDGVVMATVVAQKLDQALKGVLAQLANALGRSHADESKNTEEFIRWRLMNGNFLVIVEDVWKLEGHVDLLRGIIGIPHRCKILFTSASWDSNQSGYWSRGSLDKNIGVNTLEEEEAWRLFDKAVGNDAKHTDLDAIGRQVVKRCKGVPLLIVTIAAALSRRPTLSAWEDALIQLEGMKNLEPHEYVLSAVEFICYNHLHDLNKSMFLLCGLLDGNQIAISDLRREWSQLEGKGDKPSVYSRKFYRRIPSVDGPIYHLKESYLLLQGDSSSYVKMHDLIRYAAIEIAHKARDVIQCPGESSSTKASKAQDVIQYTAGGLLLDQTRLSRLLEKVVPDSEMKFSTLLKELKALNRVNDLVSLVSSHPMVLVTEPMREQWKTWMRPFSQLNSIRKEEPQQVWTHQYRMTVENVRGEISRGFSQIQPMLENIWPYLTQYTIEDLGKVPELKALMKHRTQMEANHYQYEHEEIMEEEPLPKLVLEFAIESAIHQITTVDWVSISIPIREVIQAFKKRMAEKFDDVFLVSVSEDWSSSIGEIEGDIANQSSSLYLIDLHERVDVSEWVQGCRMWDLLRHRKIVFISTSPISCLPVDLRIRMEDHLMPWKLFCRNIVHSFTPIREEAGELVKLCGGNLTATILMARALRDASDVNVWKEALTKLSASEFNRRVILDTAVNLVAKRRRWSIVKQCCIGYALIVCQPSCDSSVGGESQSSILLSGKTKGRTQWVDRMPLIDRWRSERVIQSHDEGVEILNDLVDAFLFEYSSGNQQTRVKPQLYQVLTSIFNPGQLVFRSINGKVPTGQEWDFLDYSSTDLSELPENPSCYAIRKLLLQDNTALTIIPPRLFQSMEVLQVLNMSNTSIKTLPESFFNLTTLTELVLRDCGLFMELPTQIGDLLSLEVLDLEGTEIIQLPVEVQNLINLTCLKLSFYGYGELPVTMIPAGVLVKLVKLTQLSIDVNPDDARWEKDVKIVTREVVTLKEMRNLKLYLPRVKRLGDLKNHFPSLIYSEHSRFYFTIGRHFKRIMSRTPLGVETEFQKRSKCLRYIDGSKVPFKRLGYALQYTKAFFLDRHHTVTKLSQFGTENMRRLEFCVLGECSELVTIIEEGPKSRWGDNGEEDNEGRDSSEEEDSYEEGGKDVSSTFTNVPVLDSLQYLIIYSMENLRSIWVSEAPIYRRSLSMLKSLRLHSCPQLTTIFRVDMLGNLGMLEELVVEDCESIQNLLVPHPQPSHLAYKPFLLNLKKVTLHYLPQLVSISSGLHIAPHLEQMSFYGCPNLKSLSHQEVSSNHLKKIRGEKKWWDGLQWKDGRPSHLANIFIPFRKDVNLMTQLAEEAS